MAAELLRPVLYISRPELRTVTIGLTTFQGEYGAQWNLLDESGRPVPSGIYFVHITAGGTSVMRKAVIVH